MDYCRAFEDAAIVLSKLEETGVVTEMAVGKALEPQSVSRRDLMSAILSAPKTVGAQNVSQRDVGTVKKQTNSADLTKIWRDSLGCDVEVPLLPKRIAPCSAYAQALLESVCPEDIVWAGSRGIHGSALAMSLSEAMRFEREDASGTKRMDWLEHTNADLAIEVEQKLSLLSVANGIVSSSRVPIVRIIAGPGELAHTYRMLGALLQHHRAYDLAQFIDCIDELLRQGRANLREEEFKRVYYGHGRFGLDTLCRGTLLEKTMESVGAYNAATELEQTACTGLNLKDIYELKPDLVILARNREDVVDTWKNWHDCPVLFIPDKPYPWLTGNPLSMQTIGALWLAHAVHPGVFDYDMRRIAESCFYAFFSRAPKANELTV